MEDHMSYIAAVLVLSLIIIVHEFGHFIAAKMNGIGIKIFSVGFGRAVLKKKLGSTEYRVSAIPVGGYVLPDIEDEHDFFRIPVKKRILFSLGGPAANIITGLLLLGIVNSVNHGVSFSSLFIEPLRQTGAFFVKFAAIIPSLFTHTDNLSGIVGIVSQGGSFIKGSALGIVNFAIIMNLNLAAFNLLPFPILDGGKVLLYSLEKIHPRFLRLHLPLSIAGWLIIIGLTLYVTFLDIGRLI